jgi:hypothetical protein
MKKLLTLAFILWFSFFSCAYEGDALWEKQQKAVKNSILYIDTSSFMFKDRIDRNSVKIEKVSDHTWESLWNQGDRVDQNTVDPTDWVITIGNTSGHDFAVVVCDADTGKVVGYIPTE